MDKTKKISGVVRRSVGFILAAVFLLTGCGVTVPDVIVQDSVVIGDDGSLKAYIIEPFDSDRYMVQELYMMADKEAKEYCDVYGQGKVELEAAELLEEDASQVRVVFTYASAEDYSEYNEGEIFYGLVKDYQGTISDVKSLKDNSAADKELLAEKHILATDEKAFFYCPYPVKYASNGVVVDENGAADTRGCDGIAIIILGK